MDSESSSIENKVVKFECSMGFYWLWTIEWCDRRLRHVTGSDHA